MMRQAQVEISQEELAAFCQRYHVRQLSLFGSVLRDDFDDESDIDVLVQFAPNATIGFLALGRMRRELSAMWQRPVDLIPQNGLKPVIRDEVLAEAQVIYAV